MCIYIYIYVYIYIYMYFKLCCRSSRMAVEQYQWSVSVGSRRLNFDSLIYVFLLVPLLLTGVRKGGSRTKWLGKKVWYFMCKNDAFVFGDMCNTCFRTQEWYLRAEVDMTLCLTYDTFVWRMILLFEVCCSWSWDFAPVVVAVVVVQAAAVVVLQSAAVVVVPVGVAVAVVDNVEFPPVLAARLPRDCQSASRPGWSRRLRCGFFVLHCGTFGAVTTRVFPTWFSFLRTTWLSP